MLVGKQWRLVICGNKVIYKEVEAMYFTETKMTYLCYNRNRKKGKFMIIERIFDYKFSNRLDYDFSYKEFAQRQENGLFLNSKIYSNNCNEEILYLSDNILIVRIYHVETRKPVHVNVYLSE